MQWRDNRSSATAMGSAFEQLRSILYQMPIAGIIINTRATQVAAFGRPAESTYDIGYRVRLRDPKQKPTPKSKKEAEELSNYIFHTGIPGDNDGLRDTFPQYLNKIARDSLTFAQDATEIVPDRLGRPAQFYHVDATTIRLAARSSPFWSPDIDKEIRYVQVVQGLVKTQYRHNDIIFGIRNPATDINNAGYGVSELEMAARVITGLLNAWTYNQSFFQNGAVPKGLINLPEMNKVQLDDFRAEWTMMMRGVENVQRVPVVSQEKPIQWVDFGRSQKDIEYSAYMDFMLKLLCAIYQITPEEINFNFGNVGQSSSLQQPDNSKKLLDSRERGLKPVLQHFAHNINTRILWPLNSDYLLEFVGLDAMTREEAVAFNTQRVRTFMMVDEIRALDDLPPLPDDEGKVVLDGTWLQNRSMLQQRRDAKQQMMMQQQMGYQDGTDQGLPPDPGTEPMDDPAANDDDEITDVSQLDDGEPEDDSNNPDSVDEMARKSMVPRLEDM